MITADSSVWIGYLNGSARPQVQALDTVLDDSANDLVLLDVVLMEVLRGLRSERERKAVRKLLAPLPVLTAGGEATALAAASLYRNLRKTGVTVRSSIDLLVGTWCIANGCLLIHDDHDFDAMAARHGLITWKTP